MLSSFQSAHAALPLPAQQGGSSFRMALRLLPASQRTALKRWRDRIDACYAGMPPPAMQDMAHHIADFGLARTDFHALIDGMLMDAQDHPLCAPAASTLDVYCDRVASAVGRLSVRVFGLPGPDGERLAHHLGRALQLTNILRDIDEDAAIGRAYLPRALLLQAGVEAAVCAAGAAAIAAHAALPAACAEVGAQALDHDDAAHTV
ncbi:MAG: squalene synthase HpnD, partial [Oxalobacteraceae bacterium]